MSGTAARSRAHPMGRALRPTDKALPTHSRAHNRALVLRQLFHSGPASRASIARSTGLTRVTVSELVAELIAAELIRDLGPTPLNTIGKPANIVELITDARQIIAVDLSDIATARAAVVDLSGRILHQITAPMGGAASDDAITRLRGLITQTKTALTAPLLGIGIGSPGVIDPSGSILQASNYGWHNIPMAQLIGEHFQVPTFVANDANAAALGEFSLGGASGDGLMVITVRRGLGAGIVLDGVLLQGYSFAAGEIGHVTAADDGPACECGRRGCLETLLAEPVLRRIAECSTPEQANAQLAQVGYATGTVLAPVVSAFNLNDLVFAGPDDLVSDQLLSSILETIQARVLPTVTEDLIVRTTSLGEDLILRGAAVLVLSGELGIT